MKTALVQSNSDTSFAARSRENQPPVHEDENEDIASWQKYLAK
jgi:hypothetical protein